MARAIFILVAIVGSVLAAPKNLPSSWPVCKKSDPMLNNCLKDAIQSAIADLSGKGAKEFGVFPIDPLIISQIDIDQGNGPVSIELHFTDLHIHGLKNAKITSINADVDNYKFVAPLTVKEGVTLKGHYKINGKILLLPIKGEGACDLHLEDVTAQVDLLGKGFMKDGQKYMGVEKFGFDVQTKRLKIKLENLFEGNKQLSDQMNVFLNENWSDILKELLPGIQQAFGAAFSEISNRIFKKVPYNKVFPA